WVVLELSSYQLADITHSPHIAACLMVVPEHLNWHADMDDYVSAKSRLFEWQNSDDVAIFFNESDTSKQIAHGGAAQKVPYYTSPGAWVNGNMITIDGQEICTTSDIKLLGTHNWQNVCAAITITWQAGVRDVSAIRSVITSFAGLPHRIEFVREVDGVRYYNDSFASGLHATLSAMDAIEGKKVMVIGGYDRMLPLDYFAEQLPARLDHIRKLVLIGESGNRLAEVLSAHGIKDFALNLEAKTMPDIVHAAKKFAKNGDAVVLSPGFASFDMFKNFEDRGLQFKEVVSSL
ncbi:UDP-N-acetylmuramoyl-L-alanine--D-glutamate ligase, partial [Candidatus Saccharibacteria bacterium]|nr:UDP-N-acetylmuramoyl-L-alanine--D-glutamate ligase [Candidatus Saccharibacteria bacterium]